MMANYKKMYLNLCNATEEAVRILIQAQRDCEELYLSSEEPNLVVLPSSYMESTEEEQ